MYVKVLPNRADGNSILFEATGQLVYGEHVSDVPPHERDYEVELGTDPFSFEPLGLLLYAETVDEEPSGSTDDGRPFWVYGYAYWSLPGARPTGVATSGDIYILSDVGKTVDRVRRS